jgi:23S rRNA (pseudouridine1915-N3)-methyltransferase|tara:strand:+ start:97643 stop:98101 length:459 start_codon:yes stop_codon:yes gene_type:complete
MRIEIISCGRLKRGAMKDLLDEYQGRIRWSLAIHEIDSRYREPENQQSDEERKILEKLDSLAFVVVLDERGNGLKSLDFAKTIENLQNTGENHIQFIIGGAEGLTEKVRDKANLLLSFGQQTWPHMMARIMLLEQVYRAQQIIAGHPYHREG